MDVIISIVEIIEQNAPENGLLQFLYFSFLGILVIFIFRFLLHLLIRLVSRRESSGRPFRIYFDKDYDYVNGWRKNTEDDDNGADTS